MKKSLIWGIMAANYGQRIKELREERGLSLMALAKAIGVSDTAICKWENQLAEPKLSYIIRMADFFDCSADFLMGRTDDLGWVEQPDLLTAEDKEILETVHGLSPQMRELAIKTLKFWKTNKREL